MEEIKNHIVCKLTGEKGKGIKSHIVPMSFIETTEGIPNIIISDSSFPKKSLTGLYDSNIVTQNGEDILKKLDDYGFKIFKENFHKFKKIKNNNKEIARVLEDYDYTKLKLFCLSILWRMSVSNLPQLSLVSLGPHEEKIRSMIVDNNAGKAEEYSVNIQYFFEEYSRGIDFFPVKTRIDRIVFYPLYFGEFRVFIKVDSQKNLKELSDFAMAPNRPLILIGSSFRESKEFSLLLKMVEKNNALIPHWFKKER